MRGIATVIIVGFVSIILFGIVGPAIVEPIGDFFLSSGAVESSQIDGESYLDNMLTSLFVYGPLLVLGSGVASAVVWYFRRERVGRRI